VRPGWWAQFRVLLGRELLVTMRNPADVAGRMLLFAWVGVFAGLVFWRLSTGLDAVRNRVNLLFCVVQLFMLLVRFFVARDSFGYGLGAGSGVCVSGNNQQPRQPITKTTQ
jgi:hypothetical protein